MTGELVSAEPVSSGPSESVRVAAIVSRGIEVLEKGSSSLVKTTDALSPALAKASATLPALDKAIAVARAQSAGEAAIYGAGKSEVGGATIEVNGLVMRMDRAETLRECYSMAEGLARDAEAWTARLTSERADLEVIGRDASLLFSARSDPDELKKLDLDRLSSLREIPGRVEAKRGMFDVWAANHGSEEARASSSASVSRSAVERAKEEGRAFLEEEQLQLVLEASSSANEVMSRLGNEMTAVYGSLHELVSAAASSLEASESFKNLAIEGQVKKQQAMEERLAEERRQGKEKEKRFEKERQQAARDLEQARGKAAGKDVEDPVSRAELGLASLRMAAAALKMDLLRFREDAARARLDFERDRFSAFRLRVRIEKGEVPEDQMREEMKKIESRVNDLSESLDGIAREVGKHARELEEAGTALEGDRLTLASLAEKDDRNSARASGIIEKTIAMREETMALHRERIGLCGEMRDILGRNRAELIDFREKRILFLLWGNTGEQFMWFGISLLGVLLASSLFRWLVRRLVVSVFSKSRFQFDGVMAEALNGPVTMAVMVAGTYLAFGTLHLTEVMMTRLNLFFESLMISNVAFLLYRACDIVSFFLRKVVDRTETKLDDQLLPLLRKAVKGLIVFGGLTLVLENIGYHVTSLVTGLGLGGLAFALAAKDTLSNFFGSLMIFTDKPFVIGDWVIFSGFEGIIEDIGIRSTKIRTWKDTVITVPNSTVAAASVENVSMFRSRRVSMTLRLRLDTSPEKIERGVEIFREILDSRPDVKDDHYIFYTDIGQDAHEIMIYYFVKSTVWRAYLEVRQQVFLEVLGRLRAEGIRLALPAEAKVETGGWSDAV